MSNGTHITSESLTRTRMSHRIMRRSIIYIWWEYQNHFEDLFHHNHPSSNWSPESCWLSNGQIPFSVGLISEQALPASLPALKHLAPNPLQRWWWRWWWWWWWWWHWWWWSTQPNGQMCRSLGFCPRSCRATFQLDLAWHQKQTTTVRMILLLSYILLFFFLKKCFLFFSICRCWQACQIVRQIQRKAPSYRIFKMMIKQIAMMRMTIKYCWWLKVPSNIFQDLNCHQRYTHSRKILCFVTSAPLLLLRSWVALSFKVVGLSGIGNTRPNLHFF